MHFVPLDLAGKRFGRLVAIESIGKNSRGARLWRCICDCGKEHVAPSDSLVRGNTRSCGCLNNEQRRNKGKKANRTTHGMSGTRIYRIWKRIKTRCHNENISDFKDYGGRGITVCEEWKTFERFRDWAMAHGYKDDLTIDRIDVNGNYEPSNCRWVDIDVQANNRRNNHLITINGQTKTLMQWAREYGLSRSCISRRLEKGLSGNALIAKSRRKKGDGQP